MRKVLYILGELTDLDVEWMITHGERLHLAAGADLIRAGQLVPAIYLLLEGELVVVGQAQGAREVARLVRGEIVGEMSFLEQRPPTTSVMAVQQSLLLGLPRTALTTKMAADSGFAVRFYRALALFLSQRLRETTALVNGAAAQSSAERQAFSELDETMLDTVSTAGAHFDRILKRIADG